MRCPKCQNKIESGFVYEFLIERANRMADLSAWRRQGSDGLERRSRFGVPVIITRAGLRRECV